MTHNERLAYFTASKRLYEFFALRLERLPYSPSPLLSGRFERHIELTCIEARAHLADLAAWVDSPVEDAPPPHARIRVSHDA